MNKYVTMTGAMIGMTLGAFLPLLWGSTDLMSLAGIGCSMLGGFFGIWLAIVIAKRFS